MKIVVAMIVLLWSALVHADTATVSWVDNSNNEEGFEVQRNLNGGAWSATTKTGPNITTYTDASLVQAATPNVYCYRVRSFNTNADKSINASAWSTGSGSPEVTACKTIAALVTVPNAPSGTKVNGGAAAATQKKAQ